MARDTSREFAQCQRQFRHAGQLGVRLGDLLHDPAKRPLAVGISYRLKTAVEMRLKILQIAVVCKNPIAPEGVQNFV